MRIALWYAFLSAAWILCSGWLLHHFVHRSALEAVLETVKGWFFVSVTALLLGWVLDRYFREIRRSSQRVQDSEAFTKAIFDSVDARIAVLDRHGVITTVNLPWQRTALENPCADGFPARNCGVGADYLAVCRNAAGESSNGADAACEGIQAVLDGRLPHFTLEYACHTPTREGWGSMMVTPLGLAEGGVVVAHTTITERKKAEEALRQSLVFRREAEKIGRIGAWKVNPTADYLYWTEGVCEILGAPLDYKPGLEEGMQFYDAESVPVLREALRCALADGKPFVVETGLTTMNGRHVWCEVRGLGRFDEGQQAFVMGTIQDITERKQLQAQLLQAQKMEAVGQLAGGVAHDFNNRLQTILGLCEFLLANIEAGDPKQQDVLEIQGSATRAAELTRQLLAFSRKQMITPVLLDLNAVVEGTQKILRHLIGEDIRIVLELANSLPAVKADTSQIEQTIMNLAVNARDAMPNGGHLFISTVRIALDESVAETIPEARVGSFVCLTVADTGVGMSREVLTHIFEPFYSTKGPGKGTGLGLSVVYGIVRQHQGWINAYSREGEGTTFKIYLPAVAGSVAQSGLAPVRPAPPKGRGERILLVEDEAVVRNLALRLLSSAGYQVHTASSAAEGVSVFEKEDGRFDLLFSDVVLPGQNGIALADQLCARSPGLAVLLCSGYTDERSRSHTIAEKNIRLLQKPYPAHELLTAVHAALVARRVA